jgi:hypothetical protein
MPAIASEIAAPVRAANAIVEHDTAAVKVGGGIGASVARATVDSTHRLRYHGRVQRHGHFVTDRRSLELHRAAFEKLRGRPELKARVLELVERWLGLEELASSRQWLGEWREMLESWSVERMTARVLDEEGGQVLRQCSPLAPVLTPQERWGILRRVNERLAARDEDAAP